jgi:branched-chain amino acid aminotransferase
MARPSCAIDGELVPLEHASVGVLDRGFLYGDAVFETLRTYRGAPFLLDRHLERLARSASLVGIALPVSTDVMAREVQATLEAAGEGECYVRITVTRGAGSPGLDPSRASKPLRVVVVLPLEPPPDDVYDVGLRAVTYATGRALSMSRSSGAKTGNYLENILAVRAARERGANEALMVDAGGRVVQGASANVFFVASGRLATPPLDSGILPGITREVVLELAAALAIPVELRAPSVSELPEFDEIFTSSSVRELAPVVEVDGVRVGAGRPGPVFAALSAAFEKRANPIEYGGAEKV